jgi:hypothetical protein
MKPKPSSISQRGVTLIAGLIMLVVITLMVISAFTLSVSNLQSVGNMQFRNEAISAANKAIELKIGSLCPSPCAVAPVGEEILVDINNDSTNDYTVTIATPACIQRLPVAGDIGVGAGCSYSLPCPPTFNAYNTVWDIDATATDNRSGASVQVRQGVRMLLTQAQCNAVCPPAPGVPCN